GRETDTTFPCESCRTQASACQNSNFRPERSFEASNAGSCLEMPASVGNSNPESWRSSHSPAAGPSRLGRRGSQCQLDDFVQPANRCTVAGLSEGFELVVPGAAEQAVEKIDEVFAAPRRHRDRRLDSIFGDHDVAVESGDGVEDA